MSAETITYTAITSFLIFTVMAVIIFAKPITDRWKRKDEERCRHIWTMWEAKEREMTTENIITGKQSDMTDIIQLRRCKKCGLHQTKNFM